MERVKNILFAFFSISVVILFATVLNFDNNGAFEIIATFLSITIGFSITALSIIATSQFSKFLYSKEDEKDNSRTLLHVLVHKFKSSTLVFITTISLILINLFLGKTKLDLFKIFNYPINLTDLLKAIIWYMTIICFWKFISLLKIFSKFVLKSAIK